MRTLARFPRLGPVDPEQPEKAFRRLVEDNATPDPGQKARTPGTRAIQRRFKRRPQNLFWADQCDMNIF